jgi:hypothetical protein
VTAAADLAVYADHRHCACGSSFPVQGLDDPEVLAIWRSVHADAPHHPVTAREAAAVRRQQERALVREATAEVGA